jgi:hypothetical protein
LKRAEKKNLWLYMAMWCCIGILAVFCHSLIQIGVSRQNKYSSSSNNSSVETHIPAIGPARVILQSVDRRKSVYVSKRIKRDKVNPHPHKTAADRNLVLVIFADNAPNRTPPRQVY